MRIGIIGAGVMGLVLAYRLSKAGHQVEVLEAAPQIGGLSTWFDFGDFIWDKYYHVILRSDDHLLKLIDELGLKKDLCWTKTKTGFLWRGQHLSMSNYWEFFSFPVLNIFQKVRLAAGIIYSSRIKDPAYLERLSAKEWLIKVFGKKIYETMWEPLLESKFGTLKEKVPATIIWSTMNRYSSTREKGGGSEALGHLRGQGLKVLLDALTASIIQHGGKVHCNAKIQSIDDSSPHEVIVNSEHQTYRFDKLISTVPTMTLKKIAPHLKGLEPTSHPPQFLGVIRLALILKRPLSPYYVTNLIDKGSPYTGIIEVSALTDGTEMGGRHLVMVPRYDLPVSEWFDKPEEEIKKIFFERMKRTWPDLEENCVRSYVHRERIVQALWIDAPPPKVQTPQTTPDGRIVCVNNELAGRSTLNNNVLVEIATRYAEECQ